MAETTTSPDGAQDSSYALDVRCQVSAGDVCAIALKAGDAIMAVYDEGGDSLVRKKDDPTESPLTRADLAANEVIVSALRSLYPHIPIVTEEQREAEQSYEEYRRRYQAFFCVDPLDGTKEFLKRNGQFTVNIALVQGAQPVLGVVYVPVQRKMYWGVKGEGSFCKMVDDTEVRRLSCAHFSEKDEGLTFVGSSSHSTPLVDAFVGKYAKPKFTAIGSSLKFMLVAEGEAAIYPRFAPSCEWDTCASQIIVEEAGGCVLQAGACSNKGEALDDWREVLKTMTPVVYNKPNLLSPFFVVFGRRKEEGSPPIACEPESWIKTFFG